MLPLSIRVLREALYFYYVASLHSIFLGYFTDKQKHHQYGVLFAWLGSASDLIKEFFLDIYKRCTRVNRMTKSNERLK